jgi:signal transduction histidine kinase
LPAGNGGTLALETTSQDDPSRRPDNNIGSAAIASILEVTSQFLYVDSLDALLQKIVKTVAETFGLSAVTIGIRNRETGLYEIRAAHGYEPPLDAQIRRIKYTAERMTRDLRPEFLIGRNTYYVPAESWELDDEDLLFVRHPERTDNARRFPDEWHENDYIDFLMYERSGDLFGFLEIDEPDNHKVPDDNTLKSIEIFSDLASIAIQNAELYDKVSNDRKKIELLIDLIGHDVNNYAQAVSGFIELGMSRKGVPEPSRKNLAKALEQVWNLNKLVNNVKLYARVESAGARDLRPMDLMTVVKDAFESAALYLPHRTAKLVLEEPAGQRASLMNDLAKEIFLNIFSNAIKFDQHDEVAIEVRIDEAVEDKRHLWVVSIADHGPGVDDAMKKDIFLRFTQASGGAKGSSGLGLHIAKTLVDSYKGRIWVEDRVKGDRSVGSVFKVALPKALVPS